MSKGQWAFRPAALKRAIKTAQEAGLTVSGFRINPQGEIHIETARGQAQDSGGDLDRWLAIRTGLIMRVRLKGINCYTAKLADGTTKTYWYAWKGGPRLRGEPGTPEFIASYNEAAAQKIKTPAGCLLSLLQAYQASDDFRQLAPRTREDYAGIIEKVIEPEYSDFPLSAFADKRTRGIFLEWRDKLALKSRRQADYAWTVLARVLSWSKDRGRISVNPCERGGRIYRGSRAEKIWTANDEAAFLIFSPTHLHLPLLLALWTGQRQGDLLRLPWSAYDGSHIRLKQSKTGCRVVIPVGAPLKAALDSSAKRSTIILTTAEGKPWTPDGFRASWRKACAKAHVVGVTFNDLRGTAVTRLALAGCTEAEIATITGHSLRDVRSILDTHYLYRDAALAESAIRKLEKRTESSK
jgi:integrase